MKPNLKFRLPIMVFLGAYAWWYLLGAFWCVNFDITQWALDSRCSVVAFGTISSIILTSIVFYTINKDPWRK